MIKFIKYFIYGWNGYPNFREWCNAQPKDLIERLNKNDLERGIKPIKNRFDYAFRNAVIHCKCKGVNKCHTQI